MADTNCALQLSTPFVELAGEIQARAAELNPVPQAGSLLEGRELVLNRCMALLVDAILCRHGNALIEDHELCVHQISSAFLAADSFSSCQAIEVMRDVALKSSPRLVNTLSHALTIALEQSRDEPLRSILEMSLADCLDFLVDHQSSSESVICRSLANLPVNEAYNSFKQSNTESSLKLSGHVIRSKRIVRSDWDLKLLNDMKKWATTTREFLDEANVRHSHFRFVQSATNQPARNFP